MAPGPSFGAVFLTSILSSFSLTHFMPSYSIRSSFLLTFITLFLAGFAFIVVYRSQLWPKLLSPLRKIPQAPGGSFWHGQFWRILREDTGAPMREWINSVPNEGVMRYTAMFNVERVLLTSADTLREVLVTKNYDFVKPKLARQTLGRLLGFGVLLAEGEDHKMQRKHLMPAFQYRHIKDLVPTFWDKSAEMVRAIDAENAKELTGEGEGAIVKISSWLSRCTLDIIGLAGMGFDFNAIADPDSELSVTYRSIFNPSRQARVLALAGQFVPLWLLRALPLARNQQLTGAAATIRRVSHDLIREKKRKMVEAKGERLDKDILSVALESGGFSDSSLVDQTMTFLAAGHETTSSASVWALVQMARHPDVQQRVREEVRAILPSPSLAAAAAAAADDSATPQQVTAEMIEQCHYLHAVCNEVLRFSAPVPLTRREAFRDTTVAGVRIPKGTDVMICPAAVNVSTDMWGPDAAEFRPDRWLGKNANSGGASSNFAMLTFLHGPRSCIGEKFSRTEYACLLAAIVGHYEFSLEPKDKIIEIQSGITMRPKGGLELRMKVVEGW